MNLVCLSGSGLIAFPVMTFALNSDQAWCNQFKTTWEPECTGNWIIAHAASQGQVWLVTFVARHTLSFLMFPVCLSIVKLSNKS